MSEEEIRARLGRLDPMAGASVEAADGPQGRARLEKIMQTTDIESPATVPSRRRWWLAAPAAAAVVVAVVLGAVVFDGGSGGGPDGGGELASTLELSAGEPATTLGSCIQVSPEVVAQVPLAFRGTVTALEGDVVSLAVDRWYVGGDAEVVALSAPAGLVALIGEIDFVVGEPYLITAFDGVVNYCGFSGPATPELQAIFDAAFPA